jgi:hypothetical protein
MLALKEEVKDLTEALRLEKEERKTTDLGVGVLAEKAANDRKDNKEERMRSAQQMDVVEGRKTEMGEMLRKMEEKDVKAAKERNDKMAQLTQQLENLKSKLEEWTKGETNVGKQTDRSTTTGEVESNDAMWEGAAADGDEYLVLTDSNGAGTTQDTIKRHMPRERQNKCRIRVVSTYTLFEAFEKVRDGRIRVAGVRVILDVTTNDIRGARGQAQTTPQELTARVGKVVAIIKEKGARGVTICEVKPMNLMDVTPFSKLLHRNCKSRKIGWCQTQLGVGDLKNDGYHILPSSLKVLDGTYAYAVMGMPVPNPTQTYQKWRHQLMEQEWPQVGKTKLNVWMRREEERRTRT